MKGVARDRVFLYAYLFSFATSGILVLLDLTVGIPTAGLFWWPVRICSTIAGTSFVLLTLVMFVHLLRSDFHASKKVAWIAAFAIGSLLTSFVYYLRVYRGIK